MEIEELKLLVKKTVKQACELKNKYTDERDAHVNYACIFSQSDSGYKDLLMTAQKIGKVIEKTPTGPLFQINSLDTISGKLNLLKIRLPDSKRPERGDADFTVSDYPKFKKRYLSKKGFKLITRDNFEMIELYIPSFNVRVYFSYPPLDQQFGLI